MLRGVFALVLTVMSTVGLLGASSAQAQDAAAGQVQFNPHSTGPGNVVTFHGRVNPGAGRIGENVFVYRDLRNCQVTIALADVSVHQSRSTGRVSGSFGITDQAGCAHAITTSQARPKRVRSGTYQVAMGCEACSVGTIVITAPTLPMTGFPSVWLAVAASALCVVGIGFIASGSRRRT